jgi:integrase
MIAGNPAVGVRKYRKKGDGHHTWSDDEIAQFKARHPSDTRAGLALALLLFTAQRRGDVVRMGWQHITKIPDENGILRDHIAVRQEKTDTPLLIPLHPELMQALDALPRTNLTFLMTERGAPFMSAGFGNWFRDRCNEAGLKHCSAHGLRKAAATRLAEAGCTNQQIRAITGHKSDASLAPYTKAADQGRLARQAITLLQDKAGSGVVQHPIHAGPKRR